MTLLFSSPFFSPLAIRLAVRCILLATLLFSYCFARVMCAFHAVGVLRIATNPLRFSPGAPTSQFRADYVFTGKWAVFHNRVHAALSPLLISIDNDRQLLGCEPRVYGV
jgi:hypothetical protein